MKTAVSIPDALFRKADRVGRRLRVSRSALYAKAIEEYVRTREISEVREALDEVYGKEASELDPGLRRAQAESIGREDW